MLGRENGAGRQSLPLTGRSRAGPSPLALSCWWGAQTSQSLQVRSSWAHPPGARPRPSTTWWDQAPHVALESPVCCPGGGCWISGSPHADLDKCSTTVGNQVEQNKSDLEGTIKIILTFDVPFLSSSKMRFNDCFNAHLPSLIHHQSSWSAQNHIKIIFIAVFRFLMCAHAAHLKMWGECLRDRQKPYGV